MATKKDNETPTVSGTMKNGTKVTVSEDLAKRLRGFTADAGKSRTAS